jgi:hypothetical protein
MTERSGMIIPDGGFGACHAAGIRTLPDTRTDRRGSSGRSESSFPSNRTTPDKALRRSTCRRDHGPPRRPLSSLPFHHPLKEAWLVDSDPHTFSSAKFQISKLTQAPINSGHRCEKISKIIIDAHAAVRHIARRQNATPHPRETMTETMTQTRRDLSLGRPRPRA